MIPDTPARPMLPPKTTPEWTADEAAATTNGAKAMMERMRKEMLSTSEIATMMDRLDQLYLAFERQSVEIRRLRSEREAQDAEIARMRAENERLGKWYDEQIHLAFEVRRLRAQLAEAKGDANAIDWMTIRDCSCKGAGCIESDYAPGTFYPCSTCNPNWCRIELSRSRSLTGEKNV